MANLKFLDQYLFSKNYNKVTVALRTQLIQLDGCPETHALEPCLGDTHGDVVDIFLLFI